MNANAQVPGNANEVFALDYAQLAREIAMDIFPISEILGLHKLDDNQWGQIQKHPKFLDVLANITREWQSAANTADRVKVKSQTGLESVLEYYIRDITNPDIPLNQRVEAGKFLARLGELDGARDISRGAGVGAAIQINISVSPDMPPLSVTAKPVLDLEHFSRDEPLRSSPQPTSEPSGAIPSE